MPKVIADKNPRLLVQISRRYNPEERRAIAQDIIDYIATRTERGLGKDATPWSGAAGRYSDTYAKSLDFKIAGKSKNNVNLTLSSEMLNSLEFKDRPGELVINLEESQRGKAQGNILGTYGNDAPIRGKRRNFLDLSRAELSAILSNYPLNDKEAREETVAESEVSRERAESILELFLDSDGD